MNGKTITVLLIVISTAVNCTFSQVYVEDKWEQHYSNGQLKEKGVRIYKEAGNLPKAATPMGLWEYWYPNGTKRAEVLFDTTGIKTNHRNAWLSDGTQILKDGNGYFPREYDEKMAKYNNEKSVFPVKDGVKSEHKVLLKNPPYVE